MLDFVGYTGAAFVAWSFGGKNYATLASDLRAAGAEVVVQEDFQQHGRTLLEKLEALNRKIGGPEKWRDFSAVRIARSPSSAPRSGVFRRRRALPTSSPPSSGRPAFCPSSRDI